MPALAWNGLLTVVKIPAGGTTSEPFATIGRIFGMTVHMPPIGAATWKLQALDPTDETSWRDVYAVPTGGAPGQVSGLPGNAAVSLSAPVFGAGVFRIVTSAAVAAETTIAIFQGMR